MALPTTLIEDDDQAIAAANAEIGRWTAEMSVRTEIRAARLRIDPADGRPELITEIRWWDDIRAIHDPADGSPDTTYEPITLGERARFTDYAIEDTAAEMAVLRADIAAKQAARAVAATPADRDALDGELDGLELEQRRLLAASQELARHRSIIAVEEAAAQAALADARTRLEVAEAAKVKHQSQAQTHDSWKDLVRTGSASTVDADAAAELAGADITFIDDELDTLFGSAKDLLAHARSRFEALDTHHEDLNDRTIQVATKLANHRAGAAPLDAALDSATSAHQTALAELRSAATAAVGSLEDSIKTIAATRLAIENHLSGAVPLLTSSQLSTITRTQTVSSATDGAALEAAAMQELDDLRSAEHAFLAAMLDLVIADPDDDLSSIAAEKTAAETARTDFRSAYDAYESSSKKGTLDRWERSVPTSFWELYAGYLRAVSRLERLAATSPADFATAVETTEAALAAASHAVRQHQRSESAARRAADLAHATLSAFETMGLSSELTRLRGDD